MTRSTWNGLVGWVTSSAVEGWAEVSRLGIGGPGAVPAAAVGPAFSFWDERVRVALCGMDVDIVSS
jgi:hypothetical protein